MVQFWQILVLAFVVVVCESRKPTFSVDKTLSRKFVQFEDFRRKFDRKYASAEEALERFNVFAKNLEKIDRLNEMEQGSAHYGINDMADWTEEEFRTRRANLNSGKLLESLGSVKQSTFFKDDNDTVPKSKDWRKEGKVTPVKNQGQCGSCWAFSMVGVVESDYAIRNSNGSDNSSLIRMSEQQLVDCDKQSQGCNGGWMDYAAESIMKQGGLDTEESYPYTGKDGNCSFSNETVAAKVADYSSLASGDEDAMQSYVGLVGPVSTAINANLLQFYRSGIIHPSIFCLPLNQTLDHAVVAVGYGKRMRTNYWIIKNSWGEKWGEKGYARIQKDTNTCGIANVMTVVQTE